jgi:hypothetical protein
MRSEPSLSAFSISPVAIRMTWTALPITSAGRYSPLGPLDVRFYELDRLFGILHDGEGSDAFERAFASWGGPPSIVDKGLQTSVAVKPLEALPPAPSASPPVPRVKSPLSPRVKGDSEAPANRLSPARSKRASLSAKPGGTTRPSSVRNKTESVSARPGGATMPSSVRNPIESVSARIGNRVEVASSTSTLRASLIVSM